MAESLTVRPLPDAPFGTEITGADPANLTPRQRELIRDAHRDGHGLICFSFERLLEADELHALTAVFGENEFAPGKIDGIGRGTTAGQRLRTVQEQVAELRARGDDPYMAYIGNLDPGTLEAKPVDGKFYGEWEWHSDMSYLAVPPTFSLLHARKVPDGGRRHRLLQPGDGGATASPGAAAARARPRDQARLHLRQQRHPQARHDGARLTHRGRGTSAPGNPPHPRHRTGGAVPGPPHQRLGGRHAAGGERAAAG